MRISTKLISTGIICMIILSGLLSLMIFEKEDAEAKTYYVGGSGGANYTSIQKAIDAASTGDTVFVYAGTYNENVYINKTISLIGAGMGNTTIDAQGNKNGILVNANWVNISGFTIKNGGENTIYGGINLDQVINCSITNNNISSNGYYGIYVQGNSNNRENHRIKNNIISYNKADGIRLRIYVSYNQITNNIITNNCLSYSNSNGGVQVYFYSNYNTITGNTIKNNNQNGILCYYAQYNVISSNNITGNNNGMRFMANNLYNLVYLNDFISNTNQIGGGGGNINPLNSTNKISYFYNNTNFTSQLGNYWDDYSGIDSDGDGIGETAYGAGALTDSFPLIKPFDNYLMIPPSIEVDLDTEYYKTKNKTVKIVAQNATLNGTLAGDLDGTINFTKFEMVTIDSGRFNGKGFFTANWTANIEGLPYQGTCKGMFYKVSSNKTIVIKGTIFGGLQGIIDGYLSESVKNSGVFDQLNSSMTINQLGAEVLFAQPSLNGTVNYQSKVNSTTQIYIVQGLFTGNCTGYYNQSLGVVLTHVRINNASHPYHGCGFSIMSYVSKLGSGQGWTYDNMVQPKIVSLTGFFTKPLWGIVFGTLNETGAAPKLSLTIYRLEVGLPPKPILNIKIWGPYIISPGQKFHYFMEVQNTGFISARDTEIVMALPINCTYNNNTGNGTYNNTTHTVTWRLDINAKTKTLLSVKVNISYGVPKGTKLYCNGSIIDYVKNKTLAFYSYKRALLTAKDPNVKSGPEGYVVPGESLNYRVEFENEGSGIAFGVYFTDTLSEYLDDSTLKTEQVISTNDSSVIGPKGIYDPGTRTITWFVGELGPGEGGYANFTINVLSNAVPGTEILNYATVYFPSVPEVTRTNGVVSIVRLNIGPIADAGSDMTVKTLENVQFDGSGSIDHDGNIVKYDWDFGDGDTESGKVVTHQYQDDGDYNVKLTVTDNKGGTDTHELVVHVLNRAPEAILETDLTDVNTNEEVTFSADQSSDLDGSVIEYYFDFGDDSNSGWLTTPSTTHEYTDGPEVYIVTLTVKDDDDEVNVNTAELEIKVNNVGPIANLISDKLEAFTFEEITFEAGSSTDADGGISEYLFDFGDGTDSGWITTSSVSHQYLDGPNEYTIKLTVKDDDRDTGINELKVKIKNRAPEAVAGDERTVDTNQEIKFDGSPSTDMDGKIRSYSWDFGDDSTDNGKKVTHFYSNNGQYTVTLTVTDDDGATATDTSIVTVNNVKPSGDFSISPASGDVTTEFEFSPTVTDPDGKIVSYHWDFGDGSTSTLAKPKHQYQTSGTYSISFYVIDDDGQKSEIVKKEITIINLPPIAIATSSVETAIVGEVIRFDASGSYDVDGNIVSLKWDFKDGTISYGESVTHIYQSKGTYVVTLIATDDNSQTATINLEITILEKVADFDNDGLADEVDPDDDNDGLPDTWEEKFELNTKNPADANMDSDNDLLTNLEEYQNGCDPTKTDTDDDGLTDLEEIKAYKTEPNNPDTDGDGYNDKIDYYPLDESRYLKDSSETDAGIELYLLLIIAVVIIILVIISMVVRKRRKGMLGEPFDKDMQLKKLTQNILTDSDNQNLNISRDQIKTMLESRHDTGAISDEAYDYINEKILDSDQTIEE